MKLYETIVQQVRTPIAGVLERCQHHLRQEYPSIDVIFFLRLSFHVNLLENRGEFLVCLKVTLYCNWF